MGFQHLYRWNKLNQGGDIMEISSGEAKFDSGNILNVTVPSLIMNKCVLIFTLKSDDTAWIDRENRVRGQITSNTNIQFNIQNASPHEKTIRWYIIHYSATSPVNVERGTHSMTGVSDNITIPAVTLANTFLINTLDDDQISGRSAMEVRYDLTTTTNIAIDCAMDGDQVIDWQAIDHPNYTVQKVAVQISAGNDIGSGTIPSAVFEPDCWITGGLKSDSAVVDGNDFCTWFWVNSTTVRVRRTDTNHTINAILYVVDGSLDFGSSFIASWNRSQINNGVTFSNNSVTALGKLDQGVPFACCIGAGWLDNNSSTAANFSIQQAMIYYTDTTHIQTERVGTTDDMRFSNTSLDFTPSF